MGRTKILKSSDRPYKGYKFYVGYKNHKPKIFQSNVTPTKKTHPRFDFVTGPFDTKKKAQNYINWMET